MDKDYQKDFTNFIEHIEHMFANNFRKHIDEINDSLSAGAKSGMFVHYFLQSIANNCALPRVIGTQSFALYKGDFFNMRVNAWYPAQDKLMGLQSQLDQFYSYEVLHNHNFHLFTVGILGGGYSSNFYKCRNFRPDFKRGDHVSLEFDKSVILEVGRACYIEADIDFHIQHRPETYSMSLNILPNRKVDHTKSQFIIDPDVHRVKIVI